MEINQISVSLFSHLNTYDIYKYIKNVTIHIFLYHEAYHLQDDLTKDLHCIKSATSLLLETKTTLFFYLYCNINHLKCIFNCVYITKHMRKYIVNKLLLHY